jgi:phosphate transport system permease protein
MSGPNSPNAITARRRSKGTRRSVRIADRLAQSLIALGGLGTILAVSMVCVFLVWVVVPLFSSESISQSRTISTSAGDNDATPIHQVTNEYLNIGWTVWSDGTLRSYRLDNGQQLTTKNLASGNRRLTAWAFTDDGGIALGFDDGSVQLGRAQFTTEFVLGDDITDGLRKLKAGEITSFRSGMIQKTPENQFRLQELSIELEEPITVKQGVPVHLIDLSVPHRSSDGEATLTGGSEILAVLTQDGELRIATVRRTKNILTGTVKTRLREGTVQIDDKDQASLPVRLKLAGLGDSVCLVWNDGRLIRFDTRKTTAPIFAEELDVVPGDATLTSLEFLIGKSSLVVGDSNGKVSVWFRVKPDDAKTPDGAVLVKGHELPGGTSAVTALAASNRSRMLAAGFENGDVSLYHVTSEQNLASSRIESGSPIRLLTLAPKDDALLGLTDEGSALWQVDAPHPESTLSSIFTPVWYEGYESSKDVWQSSSGTDDFEPKYGIYPLVFGTLKATLYSMLFGAPLALLAAIYTSEFLKPQARARVKPTIEIMASLPSVVLGFLAALFFAPLVEDVVPQMLTSLATVPFAVLTGAYLWQLIPHSTALRIQWLRLPLVFVSMCGGIGLACVAGPLTETWLFAGDIKAWLDGQVGTGTGGWMILVMPLSIVTVFTLSNSVITPAVRRMVGVSRTQFVLIDLGRFLATCVLTIVFAWTISASLSSLAWDPRGSFVDTYIQRNALVVGFIMGFAIIPIIYTISDDALASVPESLRAGSLGAGATQWQTATRIIIPTAMSGLFSAMMVGLGRAVGETMIVLMAAGNTPVMDWNIFNGFRTLSANIAVELPEAVRDSTHYRMLYLAALVLFILTFCLNTVAEIIRLRFRKKAFQL